MSSLKECVADKISYPNLYIVCSSLQLAITCSWTNALERAHIFDIDYYPLTAIPVIDMHEMR